VLVIIRIDNAMLGCENAIKFYRTSVAEYLLAKSLMTVGKE
jgi:hypothetical protein